MSALDKLIERSRQLERPHEWPDESPSVRLAEIDDGGIRPIGFATQQSYRLELRITTVFWANKAEYASGLPRRAAEAQLVDMLYADALIPVSRLRSAIFNGSRQQAYELLSELESVLRGKP